LPSKRSEEKPLEGGSTARVEPVKEKTEAEKYIPAIPSK
jgi:hypothetical protein